MLRLIDNWRHGRRFTSIQLNMLAVVCDGAFVGMAVWYESFPMSPILYALLRMGLTVVATVARFIKQRLPE